MCLFLTSGAGSSPQATGVLQPTLWSSGCDQGPETGRPSEGGLSLQWPHRGETTFLSPVWRVWPYWNVMDGIVWLFCLDFVVYLICWFYDWSHRPAITSIVWASQVKNSFFKVGSSSLPPNSYTISLCTRKPCRIHWISKNSTNSSERFVCIPWKHDTDNIKIIECKL